MPIENSDLPNIIYFLGRDWQYESRRPHLEGLGKYSRLLCVEPPITVDSPFRKPKDFLQWLAGRRGLRHLSDTLWLYRPVAIVPYYISLRFPVLECVNRAMMRASLRKVLDKLDMKNMVLMISHPAQYYAIGMLGERIVCYEVDDAYAETVTLSTGAKRRVTATEEQVLKKADIVFTSAHNLAENKKRLNPRTYFVLNAAAVAFFAKALDVSTQIPSDLLRINPPRIALIGHITENHTDIELFNYLAERHPEWSIVVIGMLEVSNGFKRSPAFVKWRTSPNIHYLGFRAYETLPAYLKGLDVCLLPYKINEYTKGVFPNKLFQYLAAGKPVVSTNIPEMGPYSGIIAIAKNYSEFEKLIEEALKDRSPERIARRIEVAKENSVEKKAEVQIGLLKQLFEAQVQGVRR